ncbi:MAG: DUF433 domain-containing protein [Armatimonadetes bacterium]|nr:DUF433 domain-containing protein [Armatimonadota bacterium]
MNFRDRIVIEPTVRGGKPTIKGTRIAVVDILDYLAAGETIEALLEEYKHIKREDILACLAFAAEQARGSRIA